MVWKLKKSKAADDDIAEMDGAAIIAAEPDDSIDFATNIAPREADFSAEPAPEDSTQFYAERMAAVDEAIASLTSSKKLTPPAPPAGSAASAPAPAIEPAQPIASVDEDDWSLDAFAPYKPPQRSGSAASAGGTSDNGLGIGLTGLEGLMPPTPPTEEIDFTRGAGQSAESAEDVVDLDELQPIPAVAELDDTDWQLGAAEADADALVIDPAAVSVSEEVERTLPYVQTVADDPSVKTLSYGEIPAQPDDNRTLTHVDLSDPVVAAAPLVVAEPIEAAPVQSAVSIRPRLEVKLGQFTATYDLISDETVIGRPDPNTGSVPDIAIEWDDAISRRHAHVLSKGNEYYVEDMGSKNGTFVNGRAVPQGSPVALVAGDEIMVGERTVMKFLL